MFGVVVPKGKSNYNYHDDRNKQKKKKDLPKGMKRHNNARSKSSVAAKKMRREQEDHSSVLSLFSLFTSLHDLMRLD